MELQGRVPVPEGDAVRLARELYGLEAQRPRPPRRARRKLPPDRSGRPSSSSSRSCIPPGSGASWSCSAPRCGISPGPRPTCSCRGWSNRSRAGTSRRRPSPRRAGSSGCSRSSRARPWPRLARAASSSCRASVAFSGRLSAGLVGLLPCRCGARASVGPGPGRMDPRPRGRDRRLRAPRPRAPGAPGVRGGGHAPSGGPAAERDPRRRERLERARGGEAGRGPRGGERDRFRRHAPGAERGRAGGGRGLRPPRPGRSPRRGVRDRLGLPRGLPSPRRGARRLLATGQGAPRGERHHLGGAQGGPVRRPLRDDQRSPRLGRPRSPGPHPLAPRALRPARRLRLRARSGRRAPGRVAALGRDGERRRSSTPTSEGPRLRPRSRQPLPGGRSRFGSRRLP